MSARAPRSSGHLPPSCTPGFCKPSDLFWYGAVQANSRGTFSDIGMGEKGYSGDLNSIFRYRICCGVQERSKPAGTARTHRRTRSSSARHPAVDGSASPPAAW